MNNVHVHLHVSDLDKSRAFYERFLGTAPAKVKPIYHLNHNLEDEASPAASVCCTPSPGSGGIDIGSAGTQSAFELFKSGRRFHPLVLTCRAV